MDKLYFLKNGALMSTAITNEKVVGKKSPKAFCTNNGRVMRVVAAEEQEIMSQNDLNMFLGAIKEYFIEPNKNSKSFPADGTLPKVTDGDELIIECPESVCIDDSGEKLINTTLRDWMTKKGFVQKKADAPTNGNANANANANAGSTTTTATTSGDGSGSSAATGGNANANATPTGGGDNPAPASGGDNANPAPTGGDANANANATPTGGGDPANGGGSGISTVTLTGRDYAKAILTDQVSVEEAAAAIVPELAIYVGSSD
ncbi:hypothetical protein J6X15_00955 [Candidatus Saccharibacteria bacterium]|nr:hypothetical protein [Candidatus Saccharibacteria bacterium]